MKPLIPAVIAASILLAAFDSGTQADVSGGLQPKPGAVPQDQIQKDISSANGRIQELMEQKKQAIAGVKKHLPFTHEGIALLKKYDALLRARYVDDEGEFLPGLEISNVDKGNINRLFKTYLAWEPLSGTMSSERVRKVVERGIDRLKDQASEQDSPDEGNSSDVQILSKKIEDERRHVDELAQLADNLGYKVDTKAVASGPAPASVSKKH